MTTIWAIFFFIFASDAPSNNRWISEWEKQFIEKSIGKREVRHTLSSIPWKSIFTSKCAWGLFVCHSTDAWFQHTLPAVLPTYMSNVLDFDMTQIGLAMILPYLLQGFVAVLGSQITDMLRRKKVITTTNIRKISSFLSASMSGLFLVLTGYVGGNHYAVISLFTMSIAALGLVFSGYQCNALDIAPRYSGIVYGISNTIAHIFAFFGPFSAGYIVVNKQSVSLWQNLFWLSFGINLTGVTAYAILGSGDEQPWAKADTCDNRSGKVLETENDRLTTTLH
ncbi:vesicular glutamate transporter 1-like isoform X1 [Clavelina lepadiformis]